MMEIGERKHTDFRRLCLSERFSFPAYKNIASFRSDITLTNEVKVMNNYGYSIGVGVSYSKLLHKTIEIILMIIQPVSDCQFLLTLFIADGLDGSGSHRIYNQINQNLHTKSYILNAFKTITLKDKSGNVLWATSSSNSPFAARPIALVCQKENYENVKFIMENMINAETSELESMGLQFPEGKVNISISRSMFDEKVAGILSGAGGAKCQLCTATNEQIKDLTLIRSGFSINRCIEDAKQIFIDVNIEEFLKLSSEHRFGITHLPASEKDITPVSPLTVTSSYFVGR